MCFRGITWGQTNRHDLQFCFKKALWTCLLFQKAFILYSSFSCIFAGYQMKCSVNRNSNDDEYSCCRKTWTSLRPVVTAEPSYYSRPIFVCVCVKWCISMKDPISQYYFVRRMQFFQAFADVSKYQLCFIMAPRST